MIDDMDEFISEFEKAANLFARFRAGHPRGSDLHLVADDAVEVVYALLDAVVARMPSPQADLT
jgi:hypothetical protein